MDRMRLYLRTWGVMENQINGYAEPGLQMKLRRLIPSLSLRADVAAPVWSRAAGLPEAFRHDNMITNARCVR